MGKEYDAYKKLWDVKEEAENNFKNYIENLIMSNGLIPTLANFLNDICENNTSEICTITDEYLGNEEDEPTETYHFTYDGYCVYIYISRSEEGYKNHCYKDKALSSYGRNIVWSVTIQGLSVADFKKLEDILPNDKYRIWYIED